MRAGTERSWIAASTGSNKKATSIAIAARRMPSMSAWERDPPTPPDRP